VGATAPRGVVDFLRIKGDLGLGVGFWEVRVSQSRLHSTPLNDHAVELK